MINSKEEYLFYREADRLSLGKKRKKPRMFGDEIWKFQILLRKYEYLINCKDSLVFNLYRNYIKIKYRNLSIKLGFEIPPNVFGPGLSIAHRGTIVVNGNSRVGKNCRIHVCTNIGTKAGYRDLAPILGDNIYIGPGAKVFDRIKIADNIVIGANSVVNKSFEEEGITIAGVPAKKISNNNSDMLTNKGADLITYI